VIANVKHYIANNQEANRFSINETIDERTMREIYLPAFEAAVMQGKVGSVMCAYPKINGTFNCENPLLLNQILKKEWRFDGFRVLRLRRGAQYGAVRQRRPRPGDADRQVLQRRPQDGRPGRHRQDGHDRRQAGPPVRDDDPVRDLRPEADRHPDPGRGARQDRPWLAAEGMVLLKNQGNVLPLDRTKLKTVALIGKRRREDRRWR
jgi:beta-glucosidase